jgi:hypothetical protein
MTTGTAVVAVALAELFVLEGTFGISLPSDRHSAISTVEIRTQALETHYVTHNRRFTVVENAPGTIVNGEPLVLRQHFFVDQQVGKEGPPDASITIEAMRGGNLKWSFQAPGERGDAVTSYGDPEKPNT